MNRDRAEKMAISMVAYYRFDGEMPDGSIHPRISVLIEYLAKKIPDEQSNYFCEKIVENSKFFPDRIKLGEIYNSLHNIDRLRIGKDNQLTEGAVVESFAKNEGVRIDCTGDYSIDDVLADDRAGMSNKEQLKKYGVKLCGQAWKANVMKFGDSEWFIWESGRKKSAGCFNTTVDMRGMEYIHD